MHATVTRSFGGSRRESGQARHLSAILGDVRGAHWDARRPHRSGGIRSFLAQSGATRRPLRSRGADTLRSRATASSTSARPLPALTARSGSRSRRWGRRWPVPARIGRAGSWAGPARAAPTPQLGGCCRCCCCCSAWRPRRPPSWRAGKRWPYFGDEGQQSPRSGRPPAALGTPAAVPPEAAVAPAAASPPASHPAWARSVAQPHRRLRGSRKRKALHSPSCRSIAFVNTTLFLWVVSGIWARVRDYFECNKFKAR